MYNQKDLEALKLFNEKAEILENSGFLKFFAREKTGITISWEKHAPITLDKIWPDEEAIRAFVLTLRFFVQKKEKSSFQSMGRIYDRLPISRQKKESFKDARKTLNSYLDAESPLRYRGRAITHREIFNVFIYGELAHADENKKAIYDEWMSSPVLYWLIYNAFIFLLETVTSFITYVQQLNKQVIDELIEKE